MTNTNTDIYLDGNATGPVLPAAVDAIVRTLTQDYGNPSSVHSPGLRARALMSAVRRRASHLLGVGDGRLLFNSGATEGIQTAVLSVLYALVQRRASGTVAGSLLLYGATEHKAVPESLMHWNRILGLHLEVRSIPVDRDGRHDLALLRRLAPDAALVCTMAANNETGAVSDIEGIATALEGSPCLWLVDCVQALGKLPLDLAATRIDYAPFSGHKLYGPKGIGMLYVRAGAPYTPLMIGGGQESGARAGTENMAGIAAMGAVLEALENGTTFRPHAELAQLRGMLVEALTDGFPGVVFNTPLDNSLPTTLNIAVPGLASGDLVDALDATGVAVSAGSACSAAKAQPSYVLQAMGLPAWRAENALRISFGPAVDDATIAEACRRIRHCGQALRNAGLLGQDPGVRLEGVVQTGAAGIHAWLVLGAKDQAAVVIDRNPACTGQIDAILRRAGAERVIELSTSNAASWPAGTGCLCLGLRSLRKIGVDKRGACYALEGPDDQPGLVFVGSHPRAALKEALPPNAVLCAGVGEALQALSDDPRPSAAPVAAPDIDLDLSGLCALLRERPDTLLVDVREFGEHLAAARTGFMKSAVSLPATQLADALPGWLARSDRAPIVFVCRSGNRSERACRCLRALGYDQAYHLDGGLVLSGERA